MLLRLSAIAVMSALIAITTAQSLTELVGLGHFNESQRKYCEYKADEKPDCETCVAKGSECFYCGGTVDRCLPYAWYFPGCELSDVRHNKCWVNISAVVIVISVIAGILLVIFTSCLCYCCCRCRAYRQAQAKKQAEKFNFQQELRRAEMQNRHSLRTKQREQELESYRIKYGLPTRMSPDGNPI
ncbi:unnamed protein product [Cylicocyclus nassatus]|uniref:Pituitary tumor-transforming gene 1 protein-interacting protein-like n=1 Tax=Cylicocyclus nassatus TaxID=53992 RepID=A0AA36GWQ3_CYLNA|nr:unnamed protein product [Cylicocyclus nassatus]